MRSLILLTALTFFCYLSACSDGTNPIAPQDDMGSISFQINRPLWFESTTKIMYSLSRDTSHVIIDTIKVEDPQQKLYVFLSNLLTGIWDFEVEALNDSNVVLYSEKLNVEVKTNERTSLKLEWGNRAGHAIKLDGDLDYINVPATDTLNSISSALTMEAWVKPLRRYYNTVVAKGSANFFFQLVKYLRPGIIFKGVTLDYTNVENYWGRILLIDVIPEGEWTHLACTYSSQEQLVTIYINGFVKYQGIASGQIQSLEDDLRIGARISEPYPEYFKGEMDEVRIWNVVRSQTEIRENMQKELDGNESGLIGYWDFNEIVNQNVAFDKSNNGHNGTILGDIKLVDSYAF